MYEYRVVEIKRVVDGDTVDATIDLGFGIWASFRFRLARVDTPERHEVDCARATEMTAAWFRTPGQVTVRTQRGMPSTRGLGDGSFGRWLGDFYRGDDSLSDILIEAGWGS